MTLSHNPLLKYELKITLEPETISIRSCIRDAITSSESESQKRTAISLLGLLRFAKGTNDLTPDEAMFIHLVRAHGLDHALDHSLREVFKLLRVLRIVEESILRDSHGDL